VAGLMSDAPLEVVLSGLEMLGAAYREIAGLPPEVEAHPFMSMSFLSLEVIPSLKLTDKGLVDVTAFAPASLFL